MSKPAYAISVETLTHSFFCLDDLVLIGRNYPEIIRDSIQELFPILRQGCFKELCDCFREFFYGGRKWSFIRHPGRLSHG